MPGPLEEEALDREAMKAAAAAAAVHEVESGMVLGLGTGSTATYAVIEIGKRMHSGALKGIAGIPTSQATERLASELGIPLLEPGDSTIDLAIDGADEIGPSLHLIKGGGGALLREKIIAAAAAQFVVIADDAKLVSALGSTFDIPLEVASYGLSITQSALESLGEASVRLDGDRRYLTDNGNPIIDLSVEPIADPVALEANLKEIPGVLASGLFIGIADRAYVAGGGGVRRIDAPERDTGE